jgi:DNA-directed RNA polymerase sigma subunit (sigma70/sigma32)
MGVIGGGWWRFEFCEQCHKGSILDQVIENKRNKELEFNAQVKKEEKILAGEIPDLLLFAIFKKKTVINPLGAKKEIANVFPLLTQRERFVIAKRFGLFGAEPETLDEVARPFSVTRERIRQIEQKTLRRIRFFLKETDEKEEDIEE